MQDDTILELSDQQVSTEMKGEQVILSLKTGVYFSLNPVGRRVWELLAEPRSVTAIAALIAAEYQVEIKQVTADVKALAQQLLDAGLVRVRA